LLGFPMVDANDDKLLLPRREAIRNFTIKLPHNTGERMHWNRTGAQGAVIRGGRR
jgi:hypothetical protein